MTGAPGGFSWRETTIRSTLSSLGMRVLSLGICRIRVACAWVDRTGGNCIMRPAAVPSLEWRLAGEDGAGDSLNVRATRLRATASTAHASELIVRPGSDGCRASKMPRDAHRLRNLQAWQWPWAVLVRLLA